MAARNGRAPPWRSLLSLTPSQSRAWHSAARTPFGSTGAARPRVRPRGTGPGIPRLPRRSTRVQRRRIHPQRTCRRQRASSWRLTRVVSEQLDLQYVRIAGSAELFLEHLHGKAHLVGEAALDHGRGIAARLVQKMCLFWLGCQVVEVALTAQGEIVHTDSFHRCWQGHRASWPVGVGIVEPTLYPDSG